MGKLESKLADLNRDGAVLRASWEGSAQQAYDERQRRWTTAADDLKIILADIKKAVAEANEGYVTTESNAAKRFGG